MRRSSACNGNGKRIRSPTGIPLGARPGSLRLFAVTASGAVGYYDAPHLLLQKFPAPAFTVTTLLDFSTTRVGDEAGLMVFGYSYAWIGLRRTSSGLLLVRTYPPRRTPIVSAGSNPPLSPHLPTRCSCG